MTARPVSPTLVLGLMFVLVVALGGCGSRVESTTAGPAATATTITTAGSASATAPTKKAPAATTSTVATTTAAPTTAAPTTAAPTTAAPTTAAPTTAPAGGKDAELCAAVKVYPLSDLVSLGRNMVDNPDGVLAAYGTIAAEAPADLFEHIKAMGPLTRVAVETVKKGEVTTADGLQQWLANSAPRGDLETWVKAQLIVAPALAQLCA